MTTISATGRQLLNCIHERGYWKVVIRPTVFEERRISTPEECWQVIESAQVNLRGYLDYPMLPAVPVTGTDWIEGGGEYPDGLEFWRFYQSAHFRHHFFISEDWLVEGEQIEQSKQYRIPSDTRWLNLNNALYSCTEIVRFAARLAFRDVLEPAAVVHIELHRLAGRRLVAPSDGVVASNGRVGGEHIAHTDSVNWETIVLPSQLIAASSDLALDAALHLFDAFDWHPSRQLLEDKQQRLLERRL